MSTTPQGFGPRPAPALVSITENTKADHDRVARAYRLQGLAGRDARRMLAISVLQFVAGKAGFIAGEDFTWSAQKGPWWSSAAATWLRGHLPATVLQDLVQELPA
jgi:hypothetical protein